MAKKNTYFGPAEELFVLDGLTLEAIAARLGPEGPSLTALSGWKQDGEWDRLRAEWAEAQAELKRDSIKLRQKLAKRALAILDKDDPGPQELYAATAIAGRLAATAGRAGAGESAAADIDRPALFLEALDFVARFLKEADPEGLKILARNFEAMVEAFKAQHTKNAKTA